MTVNAGEPLIRSASKCEAPPEVASGCGEFQEKSNCVRASDGDGNPSPINLNAAGTERDCHVACEDLGIDGCCMWYDGSWNNFCQFQPKPTKEVAREQDRVAIGTAQKYSIILRSDTTALATNCKAAPPEAPASGYTKTEGIRWCSGGGDYKPGDLWGEGADDDGHCPRIPLEDWERDGRAELCEEVCDKSDACVGFTLYVPPLVEKPQCCFRTGSTGTQNKPPGGSAICYEKDR